MHCGPRTKEQRSCCERKSETSQVVVTCMKWIVCIRINTSDQYIPTLFKQLKNKISGLSLILTLVLTISYRINIILLDIGFWLFYPVCNQQGHNIEGDFKSYLTRKDDVNASEVLPSQRKQYPTRILVMKHHSNSSVRGARFLLLCVCTCHCKKQQHEY